MTYTSRRLLAASHTVHLPFDRSPRDGQRNLLRHRDCRAAGRSGTTASGFLTDHEHCSLRIHFLLSRRSCARHGARGCPVLTTVLRLFTRWLLRRLRGSGRILRRHHGLRQERVRAVQRAVSDRHRESGGVLALRGGQEDAGPVRLNFRESTHTVHTTRSCTRGVPDCDTHIRNRSSRQARVRQPFHERDETGPGYRRAVRADPAAAEPQSMDQIMRAPDHRAQCQVPT